MALPRTLLVLVLLAVPVSLWAQSQEDASPPAILESTEKNPDPFESINRPMFALNEGMDRYFFKPLARGYHFVTPDAAQRGVGNFFANLYDANAAVNSALQGRPNGIAQSGGRFMVNSTLGLLGFIDVASKMGIRPYRTDFGHTLAIWGVPSGPYLMVPFFGPRTLRSGTGTVVDTYASVQTFLDNVRLRNTLYGIELIDSRAGLLKVDQLLSGDRYIFVRDAYLQQRESFVNDGKIEDDFSDFGDEEWDEEF